MTVKFVATVSLVAVLGWSGLAAAAGSKEAGQAKAATCAACHGMDGNSVNPEWPNLASQHVSYITKQLKNFKAGQRANPLMSPMAMILSDQDVDDVAAYFSSQALHATGETEPSKLKLGERVYRAGNVATKVPACASCHGPAGAGIPTAVYPRIGGQHGAYVALQLRAYKAGTRNNDPSSMMRTVAAGLSESEIDAVASYVQGLR
ncbi:MAG TPA: c-type cytochrome [Steroidobacteraceae bacterium]